MDTTEPTDTKREIVRSSMRLTVDIGGMGKEGAARFFRDADKSLEDTVWVYNAVIRDLWKRDAAALDALRLADPSSDRYWSPPKGTWLLKNIEHKGYHSSYQYGLRVAPGLSGRTVSAIAREVRTKWSQVRWDSLVRNKDSPPHYKCPPIPIRKDQISIVDEKSVNFPLRFGNGKRLTVPLKIKDKRQRLLMQSLVSGEWRHGSAELQRDKNRPGKWYLRISYKRLVDEVVPTSRVAAINRGIRCFLAAVTFGGDDTIVAGNDILAHLRATQARRRSYGRAYRTSGRKGRGTRKAVKRLAKNAENWRRTWNQTKARELVRWFQKRGVTTLYIEDLTGIRSTAFEDLGDRIGQLVQEWPYYDLETRLTSCAEEAGMHVVKVAPEYISQTCPECGCVDKENRDLHRWRLRCKSCGYDRHLDVAAASNVMARGERDGGKVVVGDKSLGKSGANGGGNGASRNPRANGVKSRGTRRPRGKGI